jgi:hypothetical protein
MSESIPSCIRAPPPEPLTKIRGSRISVARSAARVSFSPTTLPMLPAMNAKSVIPSTTGRPRMKPRPVTAASSIPVLACSSASLWP